MRKRRSRPHRRLARGPGPRRMPRAVTRGREIGEDVRGVRACIGSWWLTSRDSPGAHLGQTSVRGRVAAVSYSAATLRGRARRDFFAAKTGAAYLEDCATSAARRPAPYAHEGPL